MANEVMEHVYEPLKVYENIYQAMKLSGLLYGNFANHSKAMLHITPDLSDLRKAVRRSYTPIEVKIYKKIG